MPTKASGSSRKRANHLKPSVNPRGRAKASHPSLALNGGRKAVTNKLQGWPHFDEPAIRAVEKVLRSGKVNYWTGKQGMEFERRFAEWQGSKYAISVATGTAALHVALNSLGIGPGD